MAEGLIQGWLASQQAWNPYIQSSLEAKRLKQRLEAERSIKRELEMETAGGLMNFVNQGRTGTIQEAIPEFSTEYGMKSPAFRDSKTQQAIDPNLGMQGINELIPVGQPLKSGNTPVSTLIPEQKFADLNQAIFQEKGSELAGEYGQGNVNFQRLKDRLPITNKEAQASSNPIPFQPKTEYNPQPFTQEEVAGLIRAGVIDEYLKPQIEQEGTRQRLDSLRTLGLGEEDIKQVELARAGGPAYANMQLLPFRRANYQSQIDTREDKTTLDREKFQAQQVYRNAKLELDTKYKNRQMSFMDYQEQMGQLNLQARQAGLDIQAASLQQRKDEFNTPQVSEKTDEFGGTTRTVKTRGGQAPKSQGEGSTYSQLKSLFKELPTINTKLGKK